ncbi:hypothetical protein DFH09DRAFT_1361731 [Mycena vulgaris]|nr:hypothetical protein DFH09DRAFT_1361731 [Mycena vulgaris]
MSFLVTYRDILRTSPTALSLYDVIFTFIGHIPVSTVATLPGFRFLAVKAWKDFIATQDTKARGFPQLLILVNADLEMNDDARVEEYIEGAGGSIEDLTSVVWDHLLMTQQVGDLACMRRGLVIAYSLVPLTDPVGSRLFHDSLRNRGIIPRLIRLMCTLVNSFANEGVAATLTRCVVLLVVELSHYGSLRWLSEAISSGLLTAIVRHAALSPSELDIESLGELLVQIQRSTMYYSVLHELERFLPDVTALMDEESPLFMQWTEVVSVAQDRLELKREVDSPEYVMYTTCDNLECGKLMPKTNLKYCGGCRTMYYCDRSCQRLDWQDHRAFCRHLHLLRTDTSEPLTRHNDWFIRALVQQTFQRNKHEIYHLCLDNMSSQGNEHFYVAQDYTSSTALGKPVIRCYDFTAPDFIPQDDWEVQQVYYEARARKDPRIELHVVTFPGHSRIFPMRPSHAQVHEGLMRIARRRRGECTSDFEEGDGEGEDIVALERLPVHTIH